MFGSQVLPCRLDSSPGIRHLDKKRLRFESVLLRAVHGPFRSPLSSRYPHLPHPFGLPDRCVAAIIGKNPGSAKPTRLNQLVELSLEGDKFLPTVRNRFVSAFARAGAALSRGAFVRVWNLFYLYNKDLAQAVSTIGSVERPLICDSEETAPPIVWFAWGPPSVRLGPQKNRFLARKFNHPFFYDMDSKTLLGRMPTATCRVKHTQGLPSEPVEAHLASILSAGIG